MSAYDTDGAFAEVMGRPIEGTPLHMLDLFLLGEAVLNSVGACLTLGHASPANVLDYTPQPVETDHVSQHILRDLLAWTSGRNDLSPGCVERISAWVRTEWLPHQMAAVGERLGLDGAA